ncbi:MAG TPA: NUDIX hydrolase [Alphaproteobacteria bacterium]|nr:NUDIX hydrolase [Alphaproteobacteria bacterium]
MINDELLDLVDDNDNVIGTIYKREAHEKKLTHFRGANLFIRNSDGNLWIPRRTAHQKVCPLGLDFSAGGHVKSGESYEQAIEREAWEELRLDITKIGYNYLGSGHPKDGYFCFQKIYEIRSEDVPNYDKNDFDKFYWISPQQLITRIDGGHSAKQDLPKFVKRLYLGDNNV